MTLEELIQAANNGDAQAMAKVGDILFADYLQKGDVATAEEESMPWYERAAQNGSAYGAIMAIKGIKVDIAACKALGGCWDTIVEKSNAILKYSSMLLAHPDATPQMMEDAASDAETAWYNLALGLYHLDRKEEAISVLGTVGVAKGNCRMDTILRGLCEPDLSEEYDWLRVLEGNSKKLLENNDNDTNNQAILAIAFQHLALIYRAVKGNTDKAYEVLAEGVSTITHPELRGFLQEELNHYRKKMFGGYQYIE